MGVLIFTHDAQKYRVGDFVEGAEVKCSPNVKGLTVIVHKRRPTAKECLSWLPYIAHRMVWVCEIPPKINDDAVIYDTKKTKQDNIRNIDAVVRWNDRKKVYAQVTNIPMPLLLAFLRENNDDIEMWRILAQAFTNVPDSFQRALVTFRHKPVRRMNYPKGKSKNETEELPFGIRRSDKYWSEIVRTDTKVANEMRATHKDLLPKGVKKKEQSENGGWV